jgi:hypothetical protein
MKKYCKKCNTNYDNTFLHNHSTVISILWWLKKKRFCENWTLVHSINKNYFKTASLSLAVRKHMCPHWQLLIWQGSDKLWVRHQASNSHNNSIQIPCHNIPTFTCHLEVTSAQHIVNTPLPPMTRLINSTQQLWLSVMLMIRQSNRTYRFKLTLTQYLLYPSNDKQYIILGQVWEMKREFQHLVIIHLQQAL